LKNFLKILGYGLLTIFVSFYLVFLFVLPNKIDLNTFSPEINKIVKETTNFDISLKDIKLYTTPALNVGVKLTDFEINYANGDKFLNLPYGEVKLSTLNLLLLTVKAPKIVIDSPSIYLDVVDGKKINLLTAIEDILNKNIVVGEVKKEEAKPFFNPAWIKIKLSNVDINNYAVILTDTSNQNKLVLKGDNLSAFYNGKKIKLKTDAKLYNNEAKNIVANVDFDSFIPKAQPVDVEDDPAEIIDFPYFNPVQLYRTFDVKTNVNAKLKVREKSDKIWLKGFVNIDDLTANLSNYILPKSRFNLVFDGFKVKMDSNFAFVENQRIALNGVLKYYRRPFVDFGIKTDKIYLNDFLVFLEALLNTLDVKNNLVELKGTGYLETDFSLKTNFKKIKSLGFITIKDASVLNNKFGEIVADINTNILFDKNGMDLKNASALVNGTNFNVVGKIDANSVADISVNLDNMPLTGFILNFAPKEIKDTYRITNGKLTFALDIKGKIKEAISNLNLKLSDFALKDIVNNITYQNESVLVDLKTDFKNLSGNISNKNLLIKIPATDSVIKNESILVNITNEDIIVNPFNIQLNNYSLINVFGEILDYQKESLINFNAIANFNVNDLNKILGDGLSIFMNSKGVIPMKLSISGNPKIQNIICQIMADKDNFYTPVNIAYIQGKQTITQLKLRLKKGVLNIKESGIFAKNIPTEFTSDFAKNMEDTITVVETQGTIVGLDTPVPSINILKIVAPRDFNINLDIFKKSDARLSLRTFLYGTFDNVKADGHIRISNLNIPEIKLKMDKGELKFNKQDASFSIDNLLLDNSDIGIKTKWNFHRLPLLVLNDFVLESKLIDTDKLLKILEDLNGYITPKNIAQKTETAKSAPSDIPVLLSGNIFVDKLKSGDILITNTRSKLNIKENILSLNDLVARVFKGYVRGEIDVNLINSLISISMKGNNIDVERALFDALKMKDTLSGTASFDIDLSLAGATYEEQVKNLDGDINFEIKKGQFGPFGKLENLILAENIRESEFFQTTLGGIINSIATIDTTHFTSLKGGINLKDGIVNMNSITSEGNVLSFLIFGDMDILANNIDIKLRGKMASGLSDMLGPLAILNPINLTKQTPGLNVLFAQAFRLFTVVVTKEEMDMLPVFSSDSSDLNATKFQIVIKGDLAKPLTLIKSFKWLSSQEDMEKAEAFVNNLIQIQKEEEEKQARKDRFNIFKYFKKDDKVNDNVE